MLLDFTYLWLDRRLGSRLVVYTPTDDRTLRKLKLVQASLAGRR